MPDINAAMTSATAMMVDAAGMSATYTAQGGSPATITILFENDAASIDLGMGSVTSSGPRAFAKTTDVPTAKKGDALTVSSVNYTVTDVRPDGTGGTELILRKA